MRKLAAAPVPRRIAAVRAVRSSVSLPLRQMRTRTEPAAAGVRRARSVSGCPTTPAPASDADTSGRTSSGTSAEAAPAALASYGPGKRTRVRTRNEPSRFVVAWVTVRLPATIVTRVPAAAGSTRPRKSAGLP